MHELGIAFHIIKVADEFAEKNHIKEVSCLNLEVGEVSSVVPKYLEDVWKWACLNQSKQMQHCKLNIIVLKAISYCKDCKKTYDTVRYGRECPYCKGNDTYLVEGDEVTVTSIETAKEG